MSRCCVNSAPGHYGLWLFMLTIAVGIGVLSSVLHQRKVAEQAGKGLDVVHKAPATELRPVMKGTHL